MDIRTKKTSAAARHFIPRIPALHPYGAALQAFKNAVLRFCLRLSGLPAEASAQAGK
jgi:hypothetical protein